MNMLKFFIRRFSKYKLKRLPTVTELDIKCEALNAMIGENGQAIVFLHNQIKELQSRT